MTERIRRLNEGTVHGKVKHYSKWLTAVKS